MVMNYGYARGGDWDVVEDEIRGVCEEAHKAGALVKVIFETSQLTLDQVKTATEVAIKAGADFVKTSTGFNGAGATVDAVKVMLDTAKGRAKVKASGGIRDYATAKMYVDLGAKRLGIGFSSAAAIAKGEGTNENY
jgi:deoxyribose-phosphate aldolase